MAVTLETTGTKNGQTSLPAIPAKILLVDDYEPNIMIAGTYLQNFGYEFDIAHNGLDAIAMAKTGQYMAIIMDVQMPTMDGVETTRHIRNFEKQSERPCVPIIALTAHYLVADRDFCLNAGMDRYLTKPFNPAELEEVLAGFKAAEPVSDIDEL